MPCFFVSALNGFWEELRGNQSRSAVNLSRSESTTPTKRSPLLRISSYSLRFPFPYPLTWTCYLVTDEGPASKYIVNGELGWDARSKPFSQIKEQILSRIQTGESFDWRAFRPGISGVPGARGKEAGRNEETWAPISNFSKPTTSDPPWARPAARTRPVRAFSPAALPT